MIAKQSFLPYNERQPEKGSYDKIQSFGEYLKWARNKEKLTMKLSRLRVLPRL
jgi:hypothetical protein